MNKDEFIAQYGETAYVKMLEQGRQWHQDHPEKEQENSRKHARKGGKYYLKQLKYAKTGLRGERRKIRREHQNRWRTYKRIIAPTSQIHHVWRPGSAEYDGIALVGKDTHQHGTIDVIRILDGEVSVFTEKELRERGEIA